MKALDSLPKREYKYRIMVFLAICTGFRRGEIMGLEWPDINFSNNNITVERTSLYTVKDGIFEDGTKAENSERTAPLPKAITKMTIFLMLLTTGCSTPTDPFSLLWGWTWNLWLPCWGMKIFKC